ncbi:NUDIX hydrolase [Patescibacteria group bacterium]|nr:NUDIX hydrolase [Patescibacteria group bacterium]
MGTKIKKLIARMFGRYFLEYRRTIKGVCINNKEEILLIQKLKRGNEVGRWELPGGKRDKSDRSDKSALKRELAEELGKKILMFVRKCKKLESVRTDANRYTNYSHHFFQVILRSSFSLDSITLSREHMNVAWFSWEELQQMRKTGWLTKSTLFYLNAVRKEREFIAKKMRISYEQIA